MHTGSLLLALLESKTTSDSSLCQKIPLLQCRQEEAAAVPLLLCYELWPSSHEAVWSNAKGKEVFQSAVSILARERERENPFVEHKAYVQIQCRSGLACPAFFVKRTRETENLPWSDVGR